jgi:hypothetical protein
MGYYSFGRLLFYHHSQRYKDRLVLMYLLVVVMLNGLIPQAATDGELTSMAECFDKREEYIEAFGRPIKNYQIVCINVEKD